MAWGGWDKRRQHACRFCCDHFKSDRSNWFTQMARLGLAYCVWFFGGTLPRNFVLHSHRLAWRQWCLPSRPPETLKDLPPLNKYCQIFLAIRFLLVLSFLVIFLLFFFCSELPNWELQQKSFRPQDWRLTVVVRYLVEPSALKTISTVLFFFIFSVLPSPSTFRQKAMCERLMMWIASGLLVPFFFFSERIDFLHLFLRDAQQCTRFLILLSTAMIRHYMWDSSHCPILSVAQVWRCARQNK